jgi:KaiC/GvpD/RAD55 family RecA-like ATPase
MSKKQIILDFVKTINISDFTKNEAFDLFQQTNSEIRKGLFMIYIKEKLESEGSVTNFKNDSFNVIGKKFKHYDEIVTECNIMEYKSEKVDLNNIDMSKFVAIKTGTAMDKIMSKRDGIMPGTVYIVTGESGAGKTTVCTNIADYMTEYDPTKKALFISAEMDRMDWTEECIDNNRLATLDTIFMLDYLDASNYVDILYKALTSSDLIILDSFEVVVDQLKDIMNWTSKKAETKLLDLLRKAVAESGSTILAIQQFTKGGNFVGSNKIKHLLTGMMFVKFDKDGNRYVVFTKNRRAGHMVGKPMYFTKCKTSGRLVFDGFRYENEEAYMEMIDTDVKTIEDDNILFQKMLDKAKNKSSLFDKATDERK